MKSICFLLTKKRATISSIAAADMKLIIVLPCSMLKLANAPSLRLYTHDMHVTLFMKKFTLRSNHKLIAWLHWVIVHYLWGVKKYVIPVFCITKIKVRKKPMKFIHVENLHRSIFFPTFDSDNAISREATMNETTALQLSAVAGNWLIHGCQILIRKNFCILCKIVFAAINVAKIFLVE